MATCFGYNKPLSGQRQNKVLVHFKFADLIHIVLLTVINGYIITTHNGMAPIKTSGILICYILSLILEKLKFIGIPNLENCKSDWTSAQHLDVFILTVLGISHVSSFYWNTFCIFSFIFWQMLFVFSTERQNWSISK